MDMKCMSHSTQNRMKPNTARPCMASSSRAMPGPGSGPRSGDPGLEGRGWGSGGTGDRGTGWGATGLGSVQAEDEC